MTKKIIVGISAIILCLPNISAQSTLSTEDITRDLKQRCKETVNAYTYHVEYIADKKNSDKVKDDHIIAALEYFIGKGDGIKLLDDYGNPVMEDGAYKFVINPPRIEITSRYRKEPRRPYIKTYLRSLKTLPYEKISISSSEAYFVSDLQQIDENEYKAVLAYCQVFIGSNGDFTITDIDRKRAEMRITKVDYGDGKVRWKVEIGNIYAQSIEHK